MGTFFLLMLVWLIVFLATRNSAVGNLGCCTLIVIFAIVTCVEYDDGEEISLTDFIPWGSETHQIHYIGKNSITNKG